MQRRSAFAVTLSLLLAFAIPPMVLAQQPAAEPGNIERLRALDFSPFAAALSKLKPETTAAIDQILQAGTIADLQAAMAASLSSEELTLHFLARIRKHDEKLRTYLELNPNALEDARAADRLRASGKVLGPMQGIPVNLKDNIQTAGPMHTTAGAQVLLDNVAAGDAVLVKKLRAAGAVILGKANLSEFAGVITNGPLIGGTSAVGGRTVNPHGNFPTGGSSSGSAASTAAMLTMVSVGTETSGSLLAPTAWNGVVGMKPSKGVVSGEGIVPLILNNDSAGPVARTVTDAAMLLSSMDEKNTDYAAGLKIDALDGVTVGMLNQPIAALKGNGPMIQTAAAILAACGARMRPATLVDDPDWSKAGPFTTYIGGGIRFDMMPYVAKLKPAVRTLEDLLAYNARDAKVRTPFGTELLSMLEKQTKGMTDAEFRAMGLRLSKGAAKTLDAAFARTGAEVLVSLENLHSTYYATAGYPAITVPLGRREGGGSAGAAGLPSKGMPAGLTFIGKPGQDAKLLAYAYAFEQASNLRTTPAVP
ncbi:MAG: amidase family protein [Rhodocyclaceae bacterium]